MTEVRFLDLKARRDELRKMQWCICGPMGQPGTPSKKYRITHGPVVQGGKCARCVDVWRRGR